MKKDDQFKILCALDYCEKHRDEPAMAKSYAENVDKLIQGLLKKHRAIVRAQERARASYFAQFPVKEVA